MLVASPSLRAQPLSTPSDCTQANAALRARASVPDLDTAAKSVDGRLAEEGTFWSDAGHAVVLEDGKTLTLDLGAARNLSVFVIQADNNDEYLVEGSVDGHSYDLLWKAPITTEGQGLRTRHVVLDTPRTARFLRVTGSGGDTFYSVSELRAYCAKPAVWPPKLKLPPEKHGWEAIDNDGMVVIKGVLAGLGGLLLLWGFVLRRLGRAQVLRRTRDGLLAALGLASFLAWWNWGHYHFDHYIHIWEHYHYYIGAKYAPELGFARIYECTAVADMQDGLEKRVAERKMRDLAATNELHNTEAILADPTRCTKHFSEARWEAFRKDIRFFRSRFSSDRWDKSQNDHGYNATPVWTITGRLLSSMEPASWERVEELGYIDSILLVLMWAVVWWAFGWRAMCVALLWWGTNFPARYYWNGGSFLRFDWLVLMVIGVCMLKREKMFAGGIALTYGALMRIFPGFIVIALILKALMKMWRERRFVLSKAHQRFAAGCILAMAVLIPASGWATGGLESWVAFAENSKKHLSTPLTNNMGLKTVLGFDFDTRAQLMRNDDMEDPFAEWKTARRHFYAARTPLFIALILGFFALLAVAVEKEEEWVAACLGAGVVVVISELTCYYYGFLLLYGFLWLKREPVGIAACALSAVTCWFYFAWGWNDEHFAAMSLASAVTVFGVTAYWVYDSRARAKLAVDAPAPAEQAPPETQTKPEGKRSGKRGKRKRPALGTASGR